MKLKITARNFDLSDRIHEHANKEVGGLERFFNNIVSADLTLTKEKVNYTAEVRLTVYRDVLVATGEASELFPAIDQAVDKAKAQLRKYKGKLKEKKPEEVNELASALARPNTDEDEVDV